MDTAILQFFESVRCGFLTVLNAGLTLFGETLFLIVLICSVYWLYDKKFGERLVVTTFSSMTVNALLKTVVARPRPYVKGVVSRVDIDNPLISTVDLENNVSFPSGHSQMAAGMFFTSAFHFKKKWAWIVFPLLTLGVMCSRLYLGVHYPTDVIVGCTLGIAFSVFWHFIYEKWESKKYYILAGFAIISIPLAFIFPSKNTWEMCASLCALSIALPIENKLIAFENAKGVKNRIFRLLVGLVPVAIVYVGFSLIPIDEYWIKFIKYFLLILTAALLAPYLFKKLKI